MWTAAEDAQLLAGAADPCITVEDIAQRLGRGVSAVHSRAARLGLSMRRTPGWSAADDTRLAELVAADVAAVDIAAAMSRSPYAIYARARRLGLNWPVEDCHRRRTASAIRARREGRYRMRPEARAEIAARFAAASRARWADPAYRERQTAAIRAEAQSDKGRARRAERARRMGLANGPQIPPHLREDYRLLTKSKGYSKAEALALLQPQITAFEKTFDGKLWLVSIGRLRVVEHVPFNARPVGSDLSLTGCGLAGL